MTWWMMLQLPDVATRNTAMGLTYNVAAMISGAAPAVATAIVANGMIVTVEFASQSCKPFEQMLCCPINPCKPNSEKH